MSHAPTRDEHDTDRIEDDRTPKRLKTDASTPSDENVISDVKAPDSVEPKMEFGDDLLPPSRSLLSSTVREDTGEEFHLSELDVGISRYISHDMLPIHGIIKQRFTDFLVNEVDLQGTVIHLQDITEPKPPQTVDANLVGTTDKVADTGESAIPQSSDLSAPIEPENQEICENEMTTKSPVIDVQEHTLEWTDEKAEALSQFFSQDALKQLEEMYLQGQVSLADGPSSSSNAPVPSSSDNKDRVQPSHQDHPPQKDKKDKNQRGSDNRKKKTRDFNKKHRPVDDRKVFSEAIASKEDRKALHEIVRKLFSGKLETETADGQRICVKWSHDKKGNVKRGNREAAIALGKRSPFPYIHFTMQKTNRDTQDALSHLARRLHANVKDLCVSGTKDKRGVTVQKVSFKRNGKTAQDVWKMINGVSGRRRNDSVLIERGERGVRVGDFSYRKGFLELGMLKGNAFVITLRNIKVDSLETIDHVLTSLKENGFINYYGMQRFGTSSIPTHSIGLALLKSEWHKAVHLILRPRPGEYPEAAHARRAWLEDRDLDTALALMPRRVVAERCLLESYQKQKGDDRNALGAISTIPKNLRLMYIHAYQSYVWNCIVSERISSHGLKPIVGDLVFETASAEEGDSTKGVEADVTNIATGEEAQEEDRPLSKSHYQPPRVKILESKDLNKYTIFDVIMPLPGTDVAYPEGPLGEKYREFLRKDGLDPDNFHRKQKDYTLGGSYRKILHLPKELSWTTMRYTDPDVSLAQSDEDQLLNFDPPVTSNEGPFLALQIRIQLGTAAYATMALREITKTDTSSHHQTILTQASDDQYFKGS